MYFIHQAFAWGKALSCRNCAYGGDVHTLPASAGTGFGAMAKEVLETIVSKAQASQGRLFLLRDSSRIIQRSSILGPYLYSATATSQGFPCGLCSLHRDLAIGSPAPFATTKW